MTYPGPIQSGEVFLLRSLPLVNPCEANDGVGNWFRPLKLGTVCEELGGGSPGLHCAGVLVT